MRKSKSKLRAELRATPDPDLPGGTTMYEEVNLLQRKAKRLAKLSPDVTKMPGIDYTESNRPTKRFFKNKNRRKKFLRENDIGDFKLIN